MLESQGAPSQHAAPEDLRHIAFIMDGNGRWAKKRGLPREMGHRAGAKTFERIVEYCGSIGIQTVTVYAFSTENWKRPPREVEAIMKLLRQYLEKALQTMVKKQIHITILGDKTVFPMEMQQMMLRAERESACYTQHLNLAINYGGRDEIVHAANEALREKYERGETRPQLTAEDLEAHLYTLDSPPPDLIVRTAGERRLSNFLLWQASYAEFYYTPVLWPDFTPEDVDAAVNDFRERHRRYGGV